MNGITRDGLSFHETGSGNPVSYSAAVRSGDLIVTAGQTAVGPGAEPMAFRQQAELALRRVIAAVEAAGGNVETIVKVTGYLADLDDWPAYDEVYRSIISVDPKPARTTVEVVRFPPPILVEVDAIAVACKQSGE
ncbi:MAG: RidA family protein [Candidatus Limnocylindria bacterium]